MIPLVNLSKQHEEIEDAMYSAIDRVIEGAARGQGEEAAAFEEEFAAYCQVKHCVGVGSGFDGLALCLRGLGVRAGEEVILAANAFIGAALAVRQIGAIPVFVDHDADTYTLDPRSVSGAITMRTRAIVATHQYGHPVHMDLLSAFAREHGLFLVEDAPDAPGARYRGRRCGELGHAAVFDFGFQRNLSALGDAGAVVTNDSSLAGWLRAARNVGAATDDRHSVRGVCSRMDEIHAAVLRVKLPFLDEWNDTRRWLAAQYGEMLSAIDVVLPAEREDAEHVYHRFVIRAEDRDGLRRYLRQQGVHTDVHFPIPAYRQVALGRGCIVPSRPTNAEASCDSILSLPMCPFLALRDVEEIAHHVRSAMTRRKVGAHTDCPISSG